MSLGSKLKMENKGMLTASTFYAVAGIICFIVLGMDFSLAHVGVIGIFSLVTAYGLLMKRSWAVWLMSILFFVATTFSVYNLYYFFGKDLIIDISMIAYFILTWVFTAYVIARRNTLES
jgi:hypothetical protein